MSTTSQPFDGDGVDLPQGRAVGRILAAARRIGTGTLILAFPDSSIHRIVATPMPVATIRLLRPRAAWRILRGGHLGLAEAYVEGLWDSPDLRAVMALVAANMAEWRDVLEGHSVGRMLGRLGHRLRGMIGGSAPREGGPLDRGSAFHEAWLGPSMTFSSAWFGDRPIPLEAAQLAKLHRLCQAMQLRPGMRLLEIGCGWGGFAEIAARDYGCSVVGITASPAQAETARARIDRAVLSRRVEIRVQHYRDVIGQFDRIAAIETLEEAGEAGWLNFFTVLRERLRPNGIAGLQVAAIAERLFERYRREGEFAQRHIRPGSMLPSRRRLRETIVDAELALGGEFWFGRDYGETMAQWNEEFQAAWPRLAGANGGGPPIDPRFRRLWEYYFAYGEIAFRAGWADVGQLLVARNG